MGALLTEDTESLSKYAALLMGKINDASEAPRKNIAAVHSGYLLRGNEKRVDREYKIGQKVLLYTPVTKPGLSPKLACHFFEPYRIINRRSELNYEIELISKKSRGKISLEVHVKRLIFFTDPFVESKLNSEGRWDVPIDEVDAELREEIGSQSCVPTKENHASAEADISGDDDDRVLRSRKVPRPQP